MTDEQTDKTDTQGKEDNPISPETETKDSLYNKTTSLIERQEAANKKTEELIKKQEVATSNQRLSGISGGNVEVKKKTQDDLDEEQAKEFMQDDE